MKKLIFGSLVVLLVLVNACSYSQNTIDSLIHVNNCSSAKLNHQLIIWYVNNYYNKKKSVRNGEDKILLNPIIEFIDIPMLYIDYEKFSDIDCDHNDPSFYSCIYSDTLGESLMTLFLSENKWHLVHFDNGDIQIYKNELPWSIVECDLEKLVKILGVK